MPWNQDKYLAAWGFAADAHRGQTVKGSERPYIVHLAGVAMEVMAAAVAEGLDDVDLAVQSAVLHDCIEDTNVTYDDVAAEFGSAVADGVQALTKKFELEKSQSMLDSLARIRTQPREIWCVKLADRINNLQHPPGEWSREKRLSYRADAQVILNHLTEASAFLSNRLSHKIVAYQAYCQE